MFPVHLLHCEIGRHTFFLFSHTVNPVRDFSLAHCCFKISQLFPIVRSLVRMCVFHVAPPQSQRSNAPLRNQFEGI